jgi:membrane protease YdiL (CAAX protease family)
MLSIQHMKVKMPKKFSLGRQLLTSVSCCALAAVVFFLVKREPYVPPLLAGLSLFHQAILGLVIGAFHWAVSTIGFKYTAKHQATQSAVESYARLDLRGWNPLWIALAAGIGEELLFRGALQPLLGVWATSALFVLAHTRAYRFNTLNGRVLFQACGIFTVSVVFGFLALYAGLVTAIIVHVSVDIVGLCTIRRVTISPATAPG